LADQIECFRPDTDKAKPERKPAPGEPDSVHITTEGEYIISRGNTLHAGIHNTLVELSIGDILEEAPDNLDPSPATRWGKGYKGPRRESFPLPDEYALDENDTPLDSTTVRILTATFSNKRKHKPHPSIKAWNQRLPLNEENWKLIAQSYNNTLLTPRDYHLHFKHITHRRIATYNRYAGESNTCRFCHRQEESSKHLGGCPSLVPIFNTLNRKVNFRPLKNRSPSQKALDTLFGHPHPDTPACVTHLHMIAWRFILSDFYQLHYDETSPPFTETQAYSVYTRTLERYTHLVMAKAHNIRSIFQARQRRDNFPTNRLIQRTNKMIGPLFELDADARLTKSPEMEKRLKIAGIEHVGKNIPTNPQ
jgi:hypothetical protein